MWQSIPTYFKSKYYRGHCREKNGWAYNIQAFFLVVKSIQFMGWNYQKIRRERVKNIRVVPRCHLLLRFTYKTTNAPLRNPITSLKSPVTHSNVSVFHHSAAFVLCFRTSKQIWTSYVQTGELKNLWQAVVEVCSQWASVDLCSVCFCENKDRKTPVEPLACWCSGISSAASQLYLQGAAFCRLQTDLQLTGSKTQTLTTIIIRCFYSL